MEFAFSDGQEHESSTMAGDMFKIASMTSWDAAFSRPTILKVCADDEFVYGLKLTLMVYKPVWEKYNNLQKVINRSEIKDGEVYPGNLLGRDDLSDCKFLRIDKADKIIYVQAESDGFHFRRLRVRLASREDEYVYGGYDGDFNG